MSDVIHPNGSPEVDAVRGALEAELENLLVAARMQAAHLRRSLATVIDFLDRDA